MLQKKKTEIVIPEINQITAKAVTDDANKTKLT